MYGRAQATGGREKERGAQRWGDWKERYIYIYMHNAPVLSVSLTAVPLSDFLSFFPSFCVFPFLRAYIEFPTLTRAHFNVSELGFFVAERERPLAGAIYAAPPAALSYSSL